MYSNITCSNRKCYGKHWRRSSLLINLLNLKHHNLKINVFEIRGNKNIGKLFSKYELLFLGQANPSSDPSQILILQFPIPRASLPPSPSLSHFTPANWNPPSAQSSSCFSSVSLYCPTPPQVLNITKHMAIQANFLYQAILISSYIQIIMPYGSSTLSIKVLSFKSYTTRSTTTLSLIQSMLSSL